MTRRSARGESSELVRLREEATELQRASEESENLGDEDAADRLRKEAQEKGKDAMRLVARRSVR